MTCFIFTSILFIFVLAIPLILSLTNSVLLKSKYGKYYFHAEEDDGDEGDRDYYRPYSVCYSQSFLCHESSWSGDLNESFACQMIHLSSQDIASTPFLKKKHLSAIIDAVWMALNDVLILGRLQISFTLGDIGKHKVKPPTPSHEKMPSNW